MLNSLSRVAACGVPLRLLLLSEMLGLLAGAVGQVGTAWWIAQSGGSVDLSRYGVMTALCSLLAMPLLSPMGDRWPKHRLIRWARLCLLVDALALTLLAWRGTYSLPLLCACSLISVLANAALLPVQASILPELVGAERLPEAIRLRRGAQALGGLLGPGLGGAALALGGVATAMSLNLLMLGVGALGAFQLRAPRLEAQRTAAPAGWFDEIGAGLRAKWGVPLDRWWTLTGALMMVFFLPATGMLLPLRLQSLQLSALWFGGCGAALSLGLLIGVAGLADRLIERLDRVRAISAALLACGLAVGAVGLCEWGPALVLLFALMGLCMSVTQLVGQTHRMLAMPDGFRSRMTAGQFAIAQAATTLAPALAGALLLRWPVSSVYLWLSAGFLGSSLLLLAVPGLRPFLRLDHDSVKNWYGRHHPAAFAPTGARFMAMTPVPPVRPNAARHAPQCPPPAPPA